VWKLYGLQRISNSLPKLSSLQQTNIRATIAFSAINLGFLVENDLGAEN
jgi:hypothetical protein